MSTEQKTEKEYKKGLEKITGLIYRTLSEAEGIEIDVEGQELKEKLFKLSDRLVERVWGQDRSNYYDPWVSSLIEDYVVAELRYCDGFVADLEDPQVRSRIAKKSAKIANILHWFRDFNTSIHHG